MKKLFLSFCFLISLQSSFAQSILYDYGNLNLSGTNPAFAGARKDFTMTALLGNLLNGTGTPQQVSQVFGMDGQVGTKLNGMGLQAFNNNIASLNQQGVAADYAYRVPMGEEENLSFGVRGGFTYQANLLSGNGGSQFYPYAGFGALYSMDNFFLSISEPVAFTKQPIFDRVNQKPLFLGTGLSFSPSEQIMFNPSFSYEMNKISGNAFVINGKFWFNNKIGLGATYKNKAESQLNASYAKVMGSIEIQFSKSIRAGIIYDPKPYSDFAATNITNTGSFFQLLFRYETNSEKENTNHLKYF